MSSDKKEKAIDVNQKTDANANKEFAVPSPPKSPKCHLLIPSPVPCRRTRTTSV